MKFPENDAFCSFKAELKSLASQCGTRVLPVEDPPRPDSENRDQAVMLEFPDAETAEAFMRSKDYRRIASTAPLDSPHAA